MAIKKGTAGADTIFGMGSADQLFGLAGNDHLYGRAGNDLLDGGRGLDWIDGGLRPRQAQLGQRRRGSVRARGLRQFGGQPA